MLGTSRGDLTYKNFNTYSLLDIPSYNGILINAAIFYLARQIKRLAEKFENFGCFTDVL